MSSVEADVDELAKATQQQAAQEVDVVLTKNIWWHRLGFHFDAAKCLGEEDECRAPVLPLWRIFCIFLWFGCRAFGGPAAQIAMMKQELVTDGGWISEARFRRVYAVYQVLPGPEAMELACYFGLLSRGKLGALLGGLGFLLPGLLLQLLLSYIYVTFGLNNGTVQASFRCCQVVVSAIIFRSTYKLAEGALLDKKSSSIDWCSFYQFLFCFLSSVIGLNFFIAMAVCGIMNAINHTSWSPAVLQYKAYLAFSVSCLCIGFFILYAQLNGGGLPDGRIKIKGDGISNKGSTTYEALFDLGLIAGVVSFGGAYTTLPFIYSSAVMSGGWLSQKQFLDSIAITNMLPTPLVTFVTLVGFVGHGIGGALLMNLGIFLPAFSITIIGHDFFQAFVDNKLVQPFLDGIASAVIGLLLQTCFQFMRSVVLSGVDAVVFALSIQAAFHFTDKYTQPLILVVAAIAGQALYA